MRGVGGVRGVDGGGCGEREVSGSLPFIPVDGFFIYFSTYWYYIVFSHLIIFLE